MARRLPPLNALLALDAVLRRGSVKKAALELAVTPAAVSQHVKLLEQTLGLALLVRHPRGVSLTAEGERLLLPLAKGFDQLEEAIVPLTQPGRTAGVLLSTLPSLGRAWLVPLIPDLQRRFPHVTLTVSTDAKLVDFDESDVGLAIRYCTSPAPGLVAARLFGETVAPVCAPALVHTPEARHGLATLVRLPLLHDTDASRYGSPFGWEDWTSRSAAGQSPGLYFSDASLLLDAAEAGVGVALGRSPLVHARLLSGRLSQPLTEQRTSPRVYYVVTSRRQYRKAAIRELFDWFADHAAEWSAKFDKPSA
jgi:LysR family transcriptional regulator, glycine cleavage system transcriptional activator